MARLADRLPAAHVLALMSSDVFGGRVQRPMRRVVRQVQKEWLRTPLRLVHELDRPIRERVGRIKSFLRRNERLIIELEGRGPALRIKTKVVHRAIDAGERAIEATTHWPLFPPPPQVPLTAHQRAI